MNFKKGDILTSAYELNGFKVQYIILMNWSELMLNVDQAILLDETKRFFALRPCLHFLPTVSL